MVSPYRSRSGGWMVWIACLAASTAWGQASGSRGGAEPVGSTFLPLRTLTVNEAQSFITVSGSAELRVVPTEIRIVLAVMAEGEHPETCHTQIATVIEDVRSDWKALGLDQDQVVEDFISIIPRFEFFLETRENRRVAVEKKVGHVMQVNLHVRVADDAQAQRALRIAFRHGIADIIAFDYWSPQLQTLKQEARREAVQAAREKADFMFGELFAEAPPLLNVTESTQVVYPAALYSSFTQVASDDYRRSWASSDIPSIHLFRPRNTYYRGFFPETDRFASDLPMTSQISVVSQVELYYEAPGAREGRRPQDQAD